MKINLRINDGEQIEGPVLTRGEYQRLLPGWAWVALLDLLGVSIPENGIDAEVALRTIQNKTPMAMNAALYYGEGTMRVVWKDAVYVIHLFDGSRAA